MKTLKRTVIIRESDLERLLKKSVKLYNRIDIEPMTYKGIEQENLLSAIKLEQVPRYRVLPDVYEQMLFREKSLYDRRYLNWRFTMDYPDGQIYVAVTYSKPREMLYRVVFEKDYE